jgi:plasmid maintenance system killer protein
MKKKDNYFLWIVFLFLITFLNSCNKNPVISKCPVDSVAYLKQSICNPRFWQYKGETLRLIGVRLNDTIDWSAQVDEYAEAGINLFLLNPVALSVNEDSASDKIIYKKIERLLQMANSKNVIVAIDLLENTNGKFEEQKSKIDRILKLTLNYSNVLYSVCKSFDVNDNLEDSRYCSEYIRKKAEDAGVTVYVSAHLPFLTVYDDNFMSLMNQSVDYNFIWLESSLGYNLQEQWENQQFVYNFIADNPRPLMSLVNKENFWLKFLAGNAALIFENENLSEIKKYAETIAMIDSVVNYFDFVPDMQSRLISKREDGKTFISVSPNNQWILYFNSDYEAVIDLTTIKTKVTFVWVNLNLGVKTFIEEVDTKTPLKFTPPDKGEWLLILKSK